MIMSWIKARKHIIKIHRDLDAGISFDESEEYYKWLPGMPLPGLPKDLERSLNIFYAVPFVFVVLFALAVALYGFSKEADKKDEFSRKCSAIGKVVHETWYIRRCKYEN